MTSGSLSVTEGGHEMSSCLRPAIVAGILFASLASPAAKNGGDTSEPMLSVHLYDQAGVRARTLNCGTAEAARLFRAAGIRVDWEQPSAEAPEDQGIDMTNAASRRIETRRYLVVRLVRGTPANVFPGALGFALPFAHRGAHVTIFYDRMEALTKSVNAPMYVILGNVIAHEMGHVLLGSSDHAKGGLMQERWGAASWRLASAGVLAFGREEAKRMARAAVTFQRN